MISKIDIDVAKAKATAIRKVIADETGSDDPADWMSFAGAFLGLVALASPEPEVIYESAVKIARICVAAGRN